MANIFAAARAAIHAAVALSSPAIKEFMKAEAQLECSDGSDSDNCTIPENNGTVVDGEVIVQATDMEPGVNFQDFKICDVTGEPCKPDIVSMGWEITMPSVAVTSQAAVPSGSFIVCSVSGVIEIVEGSALAGAVAEFLAGVGAAAGSAVAAAAPYIAVVVIIAGVSYIIYKIFTEGDNITYDPQPGPAPKNESGDDADTKSPPLPMAPVGSETKGTPPGPDDDDSDDDEPPPNRERKGHQRGNTTRNNQRQNEQVRNIARKLKLTPEQQRILHDYISHEGYGYQEVLKIAIELFK